MSDRGAYRDGRNAAHRLEGHSYYGSSGTAVYAFLELMRGTPKVQIPIHRGQSFRRIADSVPVIADSFR